MSNHPMSEPNAASLRFPRSATSTSPSSPNATIRTHAQYCFEDLRKTCSTRLSGTFKTRWEWRAMSCSIHDYVPEAARQRWPSPLVSKGYRRTSRVSLNGHIVRWQRLWKSFHVHLFRTVATVRSEY